MSETELAKAYKEQLQSFCNRMEYFHQLPEVFHVVPLGELRNNPEAYGITQCEYEQYVIDRIEHIQQSQALIELRKERHVRIKSKAKEKAASVANVHKAFKRALSCQVTCEQYQGGSITEYLKQREKTLDKMAKQNESLHCYLEQLEAELDDLVRGVHENRNRN